MAWAAAPKAAIWTLGYETSISKWASESMPLADLGNNVLEQLTIDGIGSRPVIFITHSMGGLVAKQILSHAKSQGVRRWQKIVDQTKGIVFFSTPHAGADLANFADFARMVLRTNEQVNELKAHGSRLRELHGAFLSLVNQQQIICRTYAERQEVRAGAKVLGFKIEIPKGILVVDPTSAEPNIPGERAIPLDEDHLSICKPVDQQAIAYKSVRAFVQECLDEIEQPSGTPSANEPSSPAQRSIPTPVENSTPNLQSRQALVQALLACPTMSNHQTRNTVLNELSFKARIQRDAADFNDVMNVVSAAVNQAEGVDQLLNVVRVFEGDSIPMQKLDATAQQIKQEFSANP